MQSLLVSRCANLSFKVYDFRIIRKGKTGGSADESESLLNRKARIPDGDPLKNQGILAPGEPGLYHK
jgi:hypothetical protein